MDGRRLGLILLALVACSIAASATQKAAPAAPGARAERPVPFKPGETLEFDVSWSDVIAGTVTATVREKRASFDSIAYYIVAEGRPTPFLARLYPLYYKADTLIDVYAVLPQRGSIYSEEGNRRRMKATLFDQARRRATYEVRTDTVVSKTLQLPGPTQDLLSSLYAMRSLPLGPGMKAPMVVANDGDLYTLQVTVVGREAVTTPLGRVDAWKVVPSMDSKDGAGQAIALWISNDPRRLPLRLDAELPVGRFSLMLRRAQ